MNDSTDSVKNDYIPQPAFTVNRFKKTLVCSLNDEFVAEFGDLLYDCSSELIADLVYHLDDNYLTDEYQVHHFGNSTFVMITEAVADEILNELDAFKELCPALYSFRKNLYNQRYDGHEIRRRKAS